MDGSMKFYPHSNFGGHFGQNLDNLVQNRNMLKFESVE